MIIRISRTISHDSLNSGLSILIVVRKRLNYPNKPIFLPIDTEYWDNPSGCMTLNSEARKLARENCLKSLAEHRKPAYTARRFSITDVHARRAVQ